MRDLLLKAVELGVQSGARYLDIRAERIRSESVVAEDGEPKEAGSAAQFGVGVRALTGGSWGFAARSLAEPPEPEAIQGAVEEAVKMAKASAAHAKPVRLAPVRPAEDRVYAEFALDPFAVPLEEKMALCAEASSRMRRVSPRVKKASAAIFTLLDEKAFCSSEGAYVEQSTVMVNGSLYALAAVGGSTEYYAHREAGNRGYELIRDCDFAAQGEETARKAVELASARGALTGKTRVVLDPEFVALLVHEVVGHPSEADRIVGKEAAWAGRAWWADRVGEKLFSDRLTVVSDATIPGHLGSFRYDDEGVPSRRVVHIQNGVLREFLHSRETAAMFDVEPNGGTRASGYLFAPLIRMTNTYAEGGDWRLEEMIRDAREGVYLKGEKVPSIDSRRFNFQISAKEAYAIRNGEVAELLRGATLTGTTPEFLSSIDAAGRDVKIYPIPNCGKGDPMQTMRVGNGGPHLRGFGLVTGPREA